MLEYAVSQGRRKTAICTVASTLAKMSQKYYTCLRKISNERHALKRLRPLKQPSPAPTKQSVFRLASLVWPLSANPSLSMRLLLKGTGVKKYVDSVSASLGKQHILTVSSGLIIEVKGLQPGSTAERCARRP